MADQHPHHIQSVTDTPFPYFDGHWCTLCKADICVRCDDRATIRATWCVVHAAQQIEDAPDGKCLACPDCEHRATLRENAWYHFHTTNHGLPSLKTIKKPHVPEKYRLGRDERDALMHAVSAELAREQRNGGGYRKELARVRRLLATRWPVLEKEF